MKANYSTLLVFIQLAFLSSNYVFTQTTKSEKEKEKEIIWHVKAYRPVAKLIDIKAIDKRGRIYDVKAIQNAEQTSLLDIKALVKGKQLPIKMLLSDGKYHPVKAIDEDGNIFDIKAVRDDGLILPVKGVSRSGNIIHIRAIDNDEIFFNVIAISPDGITNAVKGIKMTNEDVEATVNGVEIFAHIKAIKQEN